MPHFSLVKAGLSIILMMWIVAPGRQVVAAPANVTFTVNTLVDELDSDIGDGLCQSATTHCSLRGAIMQANHLTAPGVTTTIVVPTGIYTLTRPENGADGEDNGDLNLTPELGTNQSIVIQGAGAANTIIDANQIDGVITVAKNRSASINGVAIRNGNRTLHYIGGGGILNMGTLSVTDSLIENNRGGTGGGIFSLGVSLTVARSTIRLNVATTQDGGGLDLVNPTTIHDSTIYANSAAHDGGGIEQEQQLYVANSTISQNAANGNGGGIWTDNTANNVTGLYNTSVIGNDADHDHDQLGGQGGGVYAGTGAHIIVANTLIAGNTVMNTPASDDCVGTLEAYGQNYLGDKTGCNIPNALNTGVVSLNTIGPLQDNGGPTWTHALLAGSEAINSTADSLGCVDETGAHLTTDQRGYARPVGIRCDVGAYQFGSAAPTPSPTPKLTPTLTQTASPSSTPTVGQNHRVVFLPLVRH